MLKYYSCYTTICYGDQQLQLLLSLVIYFLPASLCQTIIAVTSTQVISSAIETTYPRDSPQRTHHIS